MLEDKIIHVNLGRITLVVFVCCALIISFLGFDVFTAKARDVRRKADMEAVVKALELYHIKYGRYPDSAPEWQGWDLSYSLSGDEPDFLKILKDEGFFEKAPRDPSNNSSYHYRYQKYKAGSFGCDRPFYVLQVSGFELAASNIGRGGCAELNWTEFAPNGYTIQGFD